MINRKREQIFDHRLLVKFSILFSILFVINMISFAIIERAVVRREIVTVQNYEVDIVETERFIIDQKIDNILLEVRYLLDKIESHEHEINGGICKACETNIKEYAFSDKLSKDINIYNKDGNLSLGLKYHDGQILLQDDIPNSIEMGKLASQRKIKIKLQKNIYETNGIIRVLAPIFRDNTFHGVLDMKYSLSDFGKKLKLFKKDDRKYSYLLNNDGYIMLRNENEDEQEFIKRIRVINSVWDIIKDNDAGQIQNEGGLITFETIDLNSKYNIDILEVEDKDNNWKVVLVDELARYNIDYLSIEGVKYVFKSFVMTQGFNIIGMFVVTLLIMGYVVLRKINRSKVEYMASMDIMTETYNRARGMEELHQAVKKCQNINRNLTLAFIDINGLKIVNDSLGHESGDELIINMVKILKTYILEEEFIIRLGGDEFLVIMPNRNEGEIHERFKMIYTHMDEMNAQSGKPYNMSFSYGLSTMNDNDGDVYNLINNADKAMYERKRAMKKNLSILK